MHDEVNKILQNARFRFAKWLDTYKPWHRDNCITERNLTFQFATAFLDLYPTNGLAFMEVPFAATLNGPCRNHLDAYLHSKEYDLLLECKIVFGMSHIQAIVADINRMTPELIEQINKRHVDTKPNRTHGVVLAETWDRKIVDWWIGSNNVKLKWSRADLPAYWHYGFVKVKEEVDGTLFWLYGVSPDLRISLETPPAEPENAREKSM